MWAWLICGGVADALHMASEAIYNALRSACSQDPRELRTGEARLKQWETQAGYYAALAVRGKG